MILNSTMYCFVWSCSQIIRMIIFDLEWNIMYMYYHTLKKSLQVFYTKTLEFKTIFADFIRIVIISMGYWSYTILNSATC